MTHISNILVAVDFSEPSRNAIHYGLHLAMKFGAKLTLAHIIPLPTAVNFGWPDKTGKFEKEASEEAQKRLSKEIPAAYRGHLHSEVVVRSGDVRDELFKIVVDDNVDLLIMGTHGQVYLERIFLGSTTDSMLRRVPVPVLTVPGRSPKQAESPFAVPFRRVLYATDLSDTAAMGLRYCGDFVHTLGAHLTLLHVMDLRDTPAFDNEAEVRADILGKIRNSIEHERCKEFSVAEVVRGAPRQEILKYAATMEADLIVINLRSKGILERALLGSTAEWVIRSARIPVLCLPVKAAVRGYPATAAEVVTC
jgi:nucleotide-binding universal stress UspA family protein